MFSKCAQTTAEREHHHTKFPDLLGNICVSLTFEHILIILIKWMCVVDLGTMTFLLKINGKDIAGSLCTMLR